MSSIGNIFAAKELAQSFMSLLLCEFTFKSGNVLRVSTHPLSATYGGAPLAGSYEFGGNPWYPRVLNQDIGATQAMSDLGIDVPPTVTVVLADPDTGVYDQYESAEGFKGATLKLYSVLWDAGSTATGSFSNDSPTPVKFIGTCGSPSFDDQTMTIVATSLLSMTTMQWPPIRVQPLCPWAFPPTYADRSTSVSMPDSPFWQCGYSPDVTAGLVTVGVGNFQSGTAVFTSCDFSFSACVERLGDSAATIPIKQDKANRRTGRYGGNDYVPKQVVGLTRPYITGKWEEIINAQNEARYGDFVPMCYGTTWVEPLVMGIYGDGNYTGFECILCHGVVSEIVRVVVNGVEVKQLVPEDSSNTIVGDSTVRDFRNGFWHTVNNGQRNGTTNKENGWNNKGAPYGSTAAIYVNVLRQQAPETAVPQIQVLLKGSSVRTYSDVSTFQDNQYTDNLAWILLDMLVWSNWRYQDIDIQSFVDAAAKCDAQIYFNRMDGAYANVYNESNSPPYKRFSGGVMVRQRTSVGELIKGVRTAMKANLYFDYFSGKLKLIIKETIASQQAAPVDGSNFNDPVPSVTVEGVDQNGYVAYHFDQNSIRKDDNGRSTLVVRQLSYQDAPNKVTVPFQNRENGYSQDSATIIDIEDVSRIQQEVYGSFSLYGPNDFDHVRRVTNTWFAENYRGNGRLDYLGSAIGDTGGTLTAELQTTFKSISLSVGQLCLLSDAQHGISFQPFRIVSIKPSMNFEFATVTLMWHNDHWYQDSFGQENQPNYSKIRNYIARPPFNWRPGQRAPMVGDAYYDVTDMGFDVFPNYGVAVDGTQLAQSAIRGKVQVNTFPGDVAPPKLEIVGLPIAGGLWPKDESYYVGLSEDDGVTTTSLMSPLSPPLSLKLDNTQGNGDFVVQDWPDKPSGFVAFAGLHPQAMSFQFDKVGHPLHVQVGNNDNYNVASWGPPDQAFARFRWRARVVEHGGVWGEEIGIPPNVTTGSIKISVFDNYGFTTDMWAGREVSVYALTSRSGSLSTPIPIANFKVSGNSSDTLFLSSGNPTTCVDGDTLVEHDVMVMRMLPTFGEDVNGKYFEDPLWINPLNPIGTEYPISDASNTSPIVVTLNLDDGVAFPFSDGDTVVVQSVQGNDGANGGFIVASSNPANNTFELTGSTGTGAYVVDGTAALQDRGLAPGAEKGNLAFFIAGTGRGTWAKIKDNTQTRVYITGDWPVAPDSTSRLIIVRADTVANSETPNIVNRTRELVGTYLLDIRNYDKISVLLQASTVSLDSVLSLERFDPYREIYLVGNPANLPSKLPGAPFTVRAEGYGMLTVNDLKMASDKAAGNIKELNFLAPSIDETDFWVGSGFIGSSVDPVTFTASVNNRSRFGTVLKTGDYVAWNNPSNYEVDLATNVTGSTSSPVITLKRAGLGAPAGFAQFGSLKGAQSGTFYRVIPRMFSQAIRKNTFGTVAPVTDSGFPDKWEWAWENKAVLSVLSQPVGDVGLGAVHTVRPSLGGSAGTPPSPGLRTMSGAAILIGAAGVLSAGQVADFDFHISAWHSVRCVFAHVTDPPVGSSIIVDVCWVNAERTVAALIDSVEIADGDLVSYPLGVGNDPSARQMPYHATISSGMSWLPSTDGQHDWPPSMLPDLATALSAGKLLLTMTLNQSVSRVMAYPGYVSFIVRKVGSTTPGSNLIVTVLV